MLRPLDEWDERYLVELEAARSDETRQIERKASVALDLTNKPDATRAEIAKQVCAFSNAGGGFIVYGWKDEKQGGTLDPGVIQRKGNESAKDWIEKIPTKHVYPSVVGCEARVIQF